MLKDLAPIKWIVGLHDIGAYMGWSPVKTKRMALKYGFPLMRLPARTASGWAYHTNQGLIEAWHAVQVQAVHDRLVRGALGKERPVREGYKRPDYWRKPKPSPETSPDPIPNPAPDPITP